MMRKDLHGLLTLANRMLLPAVLAPAASLAQATPPTPPHPSHRAVWAPALDVSGRPSPDGRLFTYIDWSTGDLAIRDLQSSENRRLTSDGTWETPERIAVNSIWSPDGRSIAYAWSNAYVPEIRVMPTAGGQPRVLYRGDELNAIRVYDWSPDGRILALFRDKEGRSRIVTLSAESGSIRELKQLGWRRPSNMGFSPDARRVVYDLPRDERTPQRDIYLLAVLTGEETALVRDSASNYGPAWAPDGRTIVFASDRGGQMGAWQVQVDGTATRRTAQLVMPKIERMLPLWFTRDGTLFYARVTFENSGDVILTSLGPDAGPTVSDGVLLTDRNVGRNTSPTWSPDGKRLAYVSQERVGHPGFGSASIVIRDIDSGAERKIFPQLDRLLAPRHSPPRWSPDGRHLVVTGADAAQRLGLFLVDVRSSESRLLVGVDPAGRPARPSWSRDGKRVYYVRSGATGDRVMSVDIQTGTEQQVYEGRVHTVAASPTSDLIAFSNIDSLMVIPATGGTPRTLLRVQAGEVINLVGGLAWTPDGRHLVFVRGQRSNPGETGGLWAISADGDTARRLELNLGALARRNGIQRYGIRDLAMHPREPRLAFTAGLGGLQAELWVLSDARWRPGAGPDSR